MAHKEIKRLASILRILHTRGSGPIVDLELMLRNRRLEFWKQMIKAEALFKIRTLIKRSRVATESPPALSLCTKIQIQ